MRDQLDVRPVVGPHGGQPVLCWRPSETPRAGLILIHGRHASADGMWPIATALKLGEWLIVSPQATDGTWYPESFLAPIPNNEPHLTSALDRVDATVEALLGEGLVPQNIALLGFSQGACLALEYAARSERALAGVIGLSGGLIGPAGTDFDYPGSRKGLRVFLGCSDVDAHIPEERVRETESVFRALGADVTAKIYPGMGHTIIADELYESRALLRAVGASGHSPS